MKRRAPMKTSMVCGALVCLLFLSVTASAQLTWEDTQIIYQQSDNTPSALNKVAQAMGFAQAGDGMLFIGGEGLGTTGRVVGYDPAGVGGWAMSKQYTISTTAVRSGDIARLANGNAFFIFDGNDVIDTVSHYGHYGFYDATTNTWDAAESHMGTVATLGGGVSHPRALAIGAGSAITDVGVLALSASNLTYFYNDGSAWQHEYIWDYTATGTGWAGMTNYRRSGGAAVDSTGRPMTLFYDRVAGTDALQLATRTAANTWSIETVTPAADIDYYVNTTVGGVAAGLALHDDVPYIVYMDFNARNEELTRRGLLYFTMKDGEGNWTTPVQLDTDYLFAGTLNQGGSGYGEATSHIAINEDGKIVITYAYRDSSTVGETRIIVSDVNTLEFSTPEAVPTPDGSLGNGYFDPRVVFDQDDPSLVHVTYRSHQVGNYRDIYYTSTVLQGEAPPVASDVAVSGTPLVGEELTGSYTYTSETAEGTSTFRWLVADTADGAYAPIDGATALTYTPTAADWGKFLKFEVTPVDENDVAGTPAESSAFGPIEVKGDFNGDGALDTLDITGFKQALADKVTWESTNGRDADLIGDFNDDGAMDTLDITGFKQALAG